MSGHDGPTDLLAVTHRFAARNLLHPDVLPALQAAGATVVVLAPNAQPSPEREPVARA